MLGQLIAPLDYLWIRHPRKYIVDWLIPGCIVLTFLAVEYCTAVRVDFFGEKGFVVALTQFIQTLPGFYIAALAAIVTFDRPSLDQIMPGTPPEIKERRNGAPTLIQLTRRRFLCMLFAFLTAESFLVTVLGIAMPVAAQSMAGFFSGSSVMWLSPLIKGAYLLFLVQMLVATFWGLFYLGRRIHQE